MAAARLDLSELRRRTGRYGLIATEEDEIKGQVRAFAEKAEFVFESGTDREAVNMPMGA